MKEITSDVIITRTTKLGFMLPNTRDGKRVKGEYEASGNDCWAYLNGKIVLFAVETTPGARGVVIEKEPGAMKTKTRTGKVRVICYDGTEKVLVALPKDFTCEVAA